MHNTPCYALHCNEKVAIVPLCYAIFKHNEWPMANLDGKSESNDVLNEKKLKAKHSCRTYLAAMPKFMHATALHLNSVQFSADRSFLVDLSISRMSNNVAPIWHKIQVMLVRPQTKPSHAHIHPNDEITYANCFEKWRKQIKLIKYCIGFVLFPLVLCHKYSFFPYISYSLEFIRFD